MKIRSLCLWILLLVSPSLAYTQAQNDQGDTDAVKDNGTKNGSETTKGSEDAKDGKGKKDAKATDEEPECD